MLRRIAERSKPSEPTEPDIWAAENRTYASGSAVPGPRDPLLTPYVVEPERCIASCIYRRVVMVFGAQSGKSELMLDVAGARLDQRPAPILYVGPNKQFLTEQFEPRVMSLLDEAPTLMAKVSRGKSMTKTRKTVNGVPFRLAHSGSSTALKSDPAALALVDEYDEMRDDINDQGGPLGLVERRGDTYADFVCVVTSTPKRGQVEVYEDEKSGLHFWRRGDPTEIDSPIWQLFQQGTMHHWCWPCPHCDEYFVPRFKQMRFDPKATPTEAGRNSYLECPRCGGVINNEHKADMNARGRYATPTQQIDKGGNVHGIVEESRSASYWVSGLASPFVSFEERISVLVEAQQSGDTAMVQQAINAGFGELWSPGGGEVPEWVEIKDKSRRSDYHHGEVNELARHLILTADVQKHSIPYVIRAWGPRATSWLVAYGYLRGDTAEIDIWDALADLFVTPIEGMPISMAFVDSGFRPGKADMLPLNRVNEFARRFIQRVFITKGSSTPMRVPLVIMKPEVSRRDAKPLRAGIRGYRLDPTHWKSWVHERLRWPVEAHGAWNVPKQITDDYCKQIVSEAPVKEPTGRVTWLQRSKDNHFLDCEAMQAAAAFLLNMQRVPMPPAAKTGGTRPPDGTPPLPNHEVDTMAGVGRKPETPNEVASPTNDPTPTKPAPRPQGRRHVRRIVRSNYLGA